MTLKRENFRGPQISFGRLDLEDGDWKSPLMTPLIKHISNIDGSPNRSTSLTKTDFHEINDKYLSPWSTFKERRIPYGRLLILILLITKL